MFLKLSCYHCLTGSYGPGCAVLNTEHLFTCTLIVFTVCNRSVSIIPAHAQLMGVQMHREQLMSA